MCLIGLDITFSPFDQFYRVVAGHLLETHIYPLALERRNRFGRDIGNPSSYNVVAGGFA